VPVPEPQPEPATEFTEPPPEPAPEPAPEPEPEPAPEPEPVPVPEPEPEPATEFTEPPPEPAPEPDEPAPPDPVPDPVPDPAADAAADSPLEPTCEQLCTAGELSGPVCAEGFQPWPSLCAHKCASGAGPLLYPAECRDACWVAPGGPPEVGGTVPVFVCRDVNTKSAWAGLAVSDVYLRELVWIAYTGSCG
jgi:hypothetical protein